MPAALTATLDGLVSQRLLDAGVGALSETRSAVAAGLQLSFAGLLGGLTRATGEPTAMLAIAALLDDPAMRGGMLSRVFARASAILAGHGSTTVAPDPEIVLGSRLTTAVLGQNRERFVGTVSAVAGLDHRSADALLSLAAPIVLAALQHRLAGGATGPAQVEALLGVDRAAILAGLPAEMAGSLGLVAKSAEPVVRRDRAAAEMLAPKVTAAGPAMMPGREIAQDLGPNAGRDASWAFVPPPTRALRLPDVATGSPSPAAPPAQSRPTVVPVVPTSASTVSRGPSDNAYHPAERADPQSDDGWKSLLPSAVALALVALVAYLVWPQTPQVRGPTARAPAVVAAGGGPTVGAPVAPGTSAATPPGFIRRTLPNGAALVVPVDGFEARLLATLDDPWRFLSTPRWLDIDGLVFETASAEITPDTRVTVKRLGDVLAAYPTVKIKIGGYTDDQGDKSANVRLSEDRARAVRLALRDRGIASDRLEAEGYGDASPIASNLTADGRGRNRRIAVLVTQR